MLNVVFEKLAAAKNEFVKFLLSFLRKKLVKMSKFTLNELTFTQSEFVKLFL
jgi:hypothetical protein